MKRLLPSSLLGQVMASVAVALLVAQVISAVLLYRAIEERRETAILTAAAFQIVGGAERAALGQALHEERRSRLRGDGPGRRPGALPRQVRYTVTAEAPFAYGPGGEESRSETRLRAALLQEGVDPYRVAIATRRAGDDPVLLAFAQSRPRFARRQAWRERSLYLAAVQRIEGGPWETARILAPRQPQSPIGVLLFQTVLTFAILMAILYFVMRRITRPLARLTERVSDFSREPGRAVELAQTGPSDTRRLIAAHNAMEARIAALLDEKDVMLGAIGHDLKTPLAALRVRIESVSDDAQREKMARSIEDISATLDDILSLSRVGRDAMAVEPVDLGALAVAVTEEFEDLEQPVTVEDPPRLVARVQVTWIKRALRNLVSNGVRYGGEATVSLHLDGNLAVLRVADKGPGIEPDRIAAMMEPFTRGEASRNRATGGAGLGLTLAHAIAEQHGGHLVLSNASDGGLIAELRLPM